MNIHLFFIITLLITLLRCTEGQINGPSPLAVLPCSNNSTQAFVVNADGSISARDGRCIDIGDCDQIQGDAEIIVFPCTPNSGLCGGKNQQWVYHNDNSISSGLDGQCLDLNVQNGKVQTWPCISGASNQHWLKKGSQLVNEANGQCLTVAIGDTTYTNPVINRDFPDPTVMKGGDGRYYVYSTVSAGCNICVSTSSDLVGWQPVQNALPVLPGWCTGNTWAPDVTYHDGQYYMFYAAEHTGGYMCIALALSRNPMGPFNSIGDPILCSTSDRTFSAIDPKMYDAPDGNIYLYWGSDFIPINVRQLNRSRNGFAAGSNAVQLVSPSNADYESLVEGAWVTYNSRTSGYFYLFYSGDNCCGNGAHYAVLIARSRSPLGPFEKFGHPFLVAGGRWNFPGHNSIITDDAGQDWIFYHCVDNNAGSDGRKLCMDRLVYIDGWPQIASTGNTPSNSPQFGPYLAK